MRRLLGKAIVEFGNDNLNLLVPLSALLEYRNVTEAAKRLHVGQPAMSAALARLRRHYGDELLIRVGSHYELTPLAESLSEVVGVTVELAVQALRMDPSGDFSTVHRSFTIGMSEYEFAVFGAELLRRVGAQAPHVKLEFDLNRSAHIRDLPNRIRGLDAVTLPTHLTAGFPSIPLFTDTMCFAVSADNTTVSDALSAEDLEGLRWVSNGEIPLDKLIGHHAATSLIAESHVVATTDSLHNQVIAISGSDLICLLPRRFAHPLAELGKLRIVEPLMTTETLSMSLLWHPARTRERGLRWLSNMITESVAAVGRPPVGAVRHQRDFVPVP